MEKNERMKCPSCRRGELKKLDDYSGVRCEKCGFIAYMQFNLITASPQTLVEWRKKPLCDSCAFKRTERECASLGTIEDDPCTEGVLEFLQQPIILPE